MDLQDYNRDGRAYEFVLFNAENCMTLSTTLIGYSESQDRVIQYPIEMTTDEQGKISQSVEYWGDHLFDEQMVKMGEWKYQLDYRGRGGELEEFDIEYIREAEKFVGTCRLSTDEDSDSEEDEDE